MVEFATFIQMGVVFTEIKRWSENTAEVYTEDGTCKVGYVARHFMHMYPGFEIKK